MNSDINPLINKLENSTLIINADVAVKVVEFLVFNKIPFKLNAFEHQTKNIFINNKLPISKPNNKEVKGDNFTNDVEDYISKHLDNKLPSLNEIAKKFGVSGQTFKNRFQKQYSKSFYQTYLEKKMDYAAELLKQGLTASAISERIGYSHPIKFNKMFQKHFGITPKKYQQHFGITLKKYQQQNSH
jgi:AraC-like DNA-binding protein